VTDARAKIAARIKAAEPIAGKPAGSPDGDGPVAQPPAPPDGDDGQASHSGDAAPKDGKKSGGGGKGPSPGPSPQGGGEQGGGKSAPHPGPLPTSGERGQGGGLARDLACARLPLTDLGNAQRFVKRHGADFLFVAQWGWLAWDGRRWNLGNADGLVARAVHDTIFAIRGEAEALAGSDDDFVIDPAKGLKLSDKIRSWGVASQSNAHVSCIAKLAQPYVEAEAGDFDRDPMAFNALNGTLRFARRGEAEGGEEGGESDCVSFTAHDRADRITRLAGVLYDPEAVCPVYDASLARVQPAAAMRRHLHCWGGVSLTGDISCQRMAFWYGRGGNMKSTLLDAWAFVAGDYATTIAVESFLDQGRTRRGDQATPDLAALTGVRMLKTSEPERGAKLAEALIKTATGDEVLKVRHLNKEFFQLQVAFHLTMFGNYKPQISGTDDGIWRRVMFVRWLVQVPEAERDPGLLRKLKREASGILNRLLDGVRDYVDRGLVLPDEVLAATAAFRMESDPLGRFVEVCLERREGARIQSSQLYRLYQAWCVANSEKAWSATSFGRAMGEIGFARKQSNVMFWLDLAAKRSVFDFVVNPEATPDKWQAKRQEGDGEAGSDSGGEPGPGPDGGLEF
jgi:putative DNA primase/helicase